MEEQTTNTEEVVVIEKKESNNETKPQNALITKEIAESLVREISEVKTGFRRLKNTIFYVMAFIGLPLVTIDIIKTLITSDSHIESVTTFNDKTVIKFKEAGKIVANKDDKTGEVTIEVNHVRSQKN